MRDQILRYTLVSFLRRYRLRRMSNFPFRDILHTSVFFIGLRVIEKAVTTLGSERCSLIPTRASILSIPEGAIRLSSPDKRGAQTPTEVQIIMSSLSGQANYLFEKESRSWRSFRGISPRVTSHTSWADT